MNTVESASLGAELKHHHETPIFVNGVEDEWKHKKISYEQVVHLAFPPAQNATEIRYTVSWTKPDGQEGSLRRGESVEVVKDMIFDVRNTYKS